MRLPVRWSAALMVAGAFTFAACGSDTAEAPVTPDASQGPLEFTVTPNVVEFGEDELNASKTVLIGGLIAAGGYPSFGTPQFSTGDRGWYTMTTTPDFSREPLGWRFTFRLNPSAAELDGTVQATIPVNVPAARNNPQMITVRYSRCTLLTLGESRNARLDGNDPVWDRSSTYNNDINEGDEYPYDEYCVSVPAFSTVTVEMFGDQCEGSPPGAAHEDVYLYSWYNPVLGSSDGFEDSDDDGNDCSNDSIIFLENESGSSRVFTIRATSYCEIDDCGNNEYEPAVDYAFGNYVIRATLGGGDDLREGEPTGKVKPAGAKRGTPKS
ncbi:MAG TPA: hypothetical protein VFN90_10460 [Gemmatimonadales bacterium]|nr:hypothetical protein [Gemmatimonadales bacterium]